jgi:osmoprotectant transport system permease protein
MSATIDWLTSSAQWSGPDGIPARVYQHVGYSAVAVSVATLIALPVGLTVGHRRRGAFATSALANASRALPTLGLVILVFRLAPLSIWPVIAALVVIAVPPILLNAEAGIRAVHTDAREAARAMGMTGSQALWRVELPIAMPVILAGLRSAAGQVIATATIAAYVGLGGLGRFLIDGYAARDVGEITGGAIVIAVLAITVEGAFALLQRRLGRDRSAPSSLFLPTPQPKESQP